MGPAPDVRDLIYYRVSELSMVRGDGIYLYDESGRSFIDCGAGTFNLSLGYSHPEVIAAVRDQVGQLYHLSSSLQSRSVGELVRRLVDLAPAGIRKVHLNVSGGSTANEGAVKMAQIATGRRDVVTLFRGHHGQTMMMTSLSGNAFRRQSLPVLYPTGVVVPDPYCYRCFYKQEPQTCGMLCAQRIEDFIEFASTGDVACVLVEPVLGNGGNIVPPQGYFVEVQRICRERGIVLIFDEIQTGIGRTGYMFAAEHFGVTPNIMTVGKGLGGSGAQVAAILTDDTVTGMAGEDHSFTYGANVVAAAAAAKTLEVIARPGFLEHVRTVGAAIVDRLRTMQARFACIGDVRGLGLMIGIELIGENGAENPTLANELARRAPEHGLLLRTSRFGRGNVVKIRPPLIITDSQAHLLCDRVERLLEEVAG